jgi:hypothetical protein
MHAVAMTNQPAIELARKTWDVRKAQLRAVPLDGNLPNSKANVARGEPPHNDADPSVAK